MRKPIVIPVVASSCDVAQLENEVRQIKQGFLEYLECVPRKSTRTKHGLMGPVGKILAKVKAGHRGSDFLKGYALRVHEAVASGGFGGPGIGGLEILESTIERMVKLLGSLPVRLQDRVIDSVDYGLYFDLRKKELESKESRRQQWIAFLRNRYGTEKELSQAWGEEISDLDSLYLPRKSEGSNSSDATQKQRDIAHFWETQRVTTDDIEGEE